MNLAAFSRAMIGVTVALACIVPAFHVEVSRLCITPGLPATIWPMAPFCVLPLVSFAFSLWSALPSIRLILPAGSNLIGLLSMMCQY